MKKIVIIGLIITMILSLCGCTVLNNPKSNIKEGRFETIYHSVNIKNVSILVDKETKIQYICTNSGMTVLLDEDGKPLLYEESEDKE